MRAPFLAHVSWDTLGMAYLAVVHILLKYLPFPCPSAKRTPYFLDLFLQTGNIFLVKIMRLQRYTPFQREKYCFSGCDVIFYGFSHLFPFFVTYTSQINGMATIMLYIETMAFLANRRPERYRSPTLV